MEICITYSGMEKIRAPGVIRKAYGMSLGLPSPEWLLEMGAVIIGTETELIFKSRWVLPEKLLKTGFQFHYPDISSAIDEIVIS